MSRSGIVALAGRPNVGKSTLLNSLVGEKLSIVSDRPQTTRRVIRGIITRGDSQVVLVDLPGTQRPRDPLTARLAKRVQQELEGADGVLLMLNGLQGVGAGDRYLAGALAGSGVPVTVAVNKIDKLSRARLLHVLTEASELAPEAEVFPISALRGTGVGELVGHLAASMPQGPFLFEPGVSSDQPLEQLLAELIREAVIRRTFEEVPHAVEVVVEDVDRPRDGLVRVRALIWVESDSQKAILIGARGSMIRAIGTAARAELERELNSHVHLDLSVRVRRHWRNDEALLDRLGMS
ncbi:MAG TPA: GTPase Era [Solirubrobacteraceae bacterium]|nr:GTPase Era [Solirubrobacteraceae bacterium]